MHQKVRVRLTALFTSITILLLTALLSVSFLMSARQQYAMILSTFSGQAYTVREEIRRQNVLTSSWLESQEKSGGYYLFLTDNGTPLLHNRTHSDDIQALARKQFSILDRAQADVSEKTSLTLLSDTADIWGSRNILFPKAMLSRTQIAKNSSLLEIRIIRPLDDYRRQLWSSLWIYLLLLLIGGGLLAAFCWHFTGRLLDPLQKSEKSHIRFIFDASHELRTPLAVILSSAAACEHAPSEQQGSFFAVIRREGRQMTELIEQLLTLCRADSHGIQLQLQQADLQTLLLQAYESFLPLAVENGHQLSIRLPEQEIPPCCCDQDRISQTLSILLHNAISHTPAGCRIELSLKLSGKYMALSVTDNGPGIPDSEKELVFHRFYHIHTASDSDDGHHGLGLSVAKELIMAHRGTLTVSDAKGGGAVFTVKIPLEQTSSV